MQVLTYCCVASVDEWSCDCEDYSQSIDGALMAELAYHRFLDVDAISNPRRKQRALVRRNDAAESITSSWVYRANGVSVLQANSAQRIYAIFARYFISGGDAFWDGNPNIASSIQAFTVPRYFSARGAR